MTRQELLNAIDQKKEFQVRYNNEWADVPDRDVMYVGIESIAFVVGPRVRRASFDEIRIKQSEPKPIAAHRVSSCLGRGGTIVMKDGRAVDLHHYVIIQSFHDILVKRRDEGAWLYYQTKDVEKLIEGVGK